MSYLRWLCAMHFAKLTRHGTALVETVNAFRLHRQQKTLACEAAAKARAELWSRLADNLRRFRDGQTSFLRKSIQSRCLDHVHRTDVHVHETGIETVKDSGSFRPAAKDVTKCTFRGEQANPASAKATSLPTVFGSNFCQTGESIGKLLQQRMQSHAPRQMPAKSVNKKGNATPQKPLTLLPLSESCPWPEGEPSGKLQQFALQADQKASAEANKPTDEPALLVRPPLYSQPKCKAPQSLPTMQMCNAPCKSSQNQRAMLLPETPNILVLPEVSDSRAILQKHATSTYDAQLQMGGQCCDHELKLVPAPTNPANSSAECQLPASNPQNCLLPPQSDNPTTILVTNVLDKYKIISLPAGRAIPERPKRHAQFEAKKRSPVRACNYPDVKRRKF